MPSTREGSAAWPPLPSRTVTFEARPPTGPRDVCTTDVQIRATLKQLISTLRVIIDGVDTPVARTTVQILDAVEPVLTTL